MGKMKWIYTMVQDGTSQAFIDAYRKAKLTNALGFTYDFIFYDIVKAKAIILTIKIAEKEYDKHIDIRFEQERKYLES